MTPREIEHEVVWSGVQERRGEAKIELVSNELQRKSGLINF